MKHYFFVLFTFLTGMLPSLHCTHENTAGVISETTNGARLEGRLLNINGAPLSNIPVTLRSIASCRNCADISERVVLSDEGSYAFDSVPGGTYVVYATVDSQAAALTITIPYDSGEIAAADLMVSSTVTKSGMITAPPGAYPVTISVCGTDISTSTDNTGRFTLSHLPKVDFLLRISSASQPLPVVVVPSAFSVPLDTVTYDSTQRVLIDNFDDGDGAHLLMPFLGSGHWYARYETTMTLSPAISPDDVSAALLEAGAWHKKSLVVNISGMAYGEMFIIACELGTGLGKVDEPLRWFNLSDMTSMTFAAKGEGIVHVAILTRKIYAEYSGADHFEKSITLTPEWTIYRIEAGDFRPPEGSDAAGKGVTWRDAAGYVAEISFFSDNATSIGLDDLYLEGVNTLDLIKSGTRR